MARMRYAKSELDALDEFGAVPVDRHLTGSCPAHRVPITFLDLYRSVNS